MERVERTNAEVVCPQQRIGLAQCNLYAMDVDKKKNWNCYNCGGFGHLARNCRNRGTKGRIGQERRLEYRENENNRQRRMIEGENRQNNGNNLNGDRDLIVLN